MADSKEKLFSDFAPTTTEQWMDKVTADLKGADFEKKLVWKTNEGFKVKPFYRMDFPVNSLISEAPRKTTTNGWYARKSRWSARRKLTQKRWIF